MSESEFIPLYRMCRHNLPLVLDPQYETVPLSPGWLRNQPLEIYCRFGLRSLETSPSFLHFHTTKWPLKSRRNCSWLAVAIHRGF